MACELFDNFRLVGGTALALQLGHRISVDIDLFTDAPYASIDFDELESYLISHFMHASLLSSGRTAMGRQYFLGKNEKDTVKLDLYYTDPFIQPPLVEEGIRMASIEEIIAMKMDVIQRGGRKKDFWDLHELMDSYSIEAMLKLHEERYPYTNDRSLMLKKLVDFTVAEGDFEPECLNGKFWDIIKMEMMEAIK